MAELRGNKAVEDAAVAWVVELERGVGREARDVRYTGSEGDIESPPRLIEVKAVGKPSARGEFLWLETNQVDAARENPKFYVYLVENVRQGDPSQFTVRVFGGERLSALLVRAKERRYYEVPLPVGICDSTPLGSPSKVEPTGGDAERATPRRHRSSDSAGRRSRLVRRNRQAEGARVSGCGL